MKTSLANARQTQAAESVADGVIALKEQLDRVETLLNTLLEALAHDAAGELDTEAKPKRGRPTASK